VTFVRMKKIIALLVLLSLLLVGCGKQNAEEKEPALADTEINVKYVVYHSTDADVNTKQAALCLQTAIQQNAKLTLRLVTDKPAQNYIEVKVDDSLSAGAYEIKSYGDHIVLRASDSYTLVCAARDFRQKWIATDGAFSSGKAKLAADQCTSFSGAYNRENMPFLIMSQNILFVEYDSPNSLVERSDRFKKLLQEYQPDVIGFQEFGESNFSYVDYMAQTYGRIGDDAESNPIMYRKDRYNVVEQGKFWLSDTPDTPSRYEGVGSNRYCMWVVLEDKITGKKIQVTNTHLCWEGNDNEMRLKQIKVLLNYMKDRLDKYPTYMTGDYNSYVDGAVYDAVLETGKLDPHLTAKTNLSSIDYTCGFYDSAEHCRIDFCFYNDQSVALEYKILNDIYSGYISDHYAIITKFELKQ